MCDFTGETVKTTEKCEENTRTLKHMWNVPVKTQVKLLHDHKHKTIRKCFILKNCQNVEQESKEAKRAAREMAQHSDYYRLLLFPISQYTLHYNYKL